MRGKFEILPSPFSIPMISGFSIRVLFVMSYIGFNGAIRYLPRGAVVVSDFREIIIVGF